ncbi:uncharacterized protein [Vicugna pacos]|uniref:Uncharacterized protein isoform X2 n=1 Tax=Vicugna pacos TaxID=30538 RepID=A0ABM5C6X4_VICPA
MHCRKMFKAEIPFSSVMTCEDDDKLGAKALLFLGVNMYGVFVRILAECSQRKALLQFRNCTEDRLRLEDENEKQRRRLQRRRLQRRRRGPSGRRGAGRAAAAELRVQRGGGGRAPRGGPRAGVGRGAALQQPATSARAPTASCGCGDEFGCF